MYVVGVIMIKRGRKSFIGRGFVLGWCFVLIFFLLVI